jgi:hypothetical protein
MGMGKAGKEPEPSRAVAKEITAKVENTFAAGKSQVASLNPKP